MSDDETRFDRANADRQRQLETLERASQRFGTTLSDAFARNVAAGRQLETVLGAVGQALLRASLRAAAGPLRSGFASLLKGAFGAGDAADTTALARGGVIAEGRVTPFAEGGVVAAPTYFPLAGDRVGLMGEAGPEAVLPLARGPDGRLGVRAGGGRPVAVTVNITTPDAESFRRSEAQVAATLARAVARGQRGL